MRYVCKRCGSPLEATVPLWLTFDDEGQPFLAFSPAVEIDVVKLYCKDHEHPVTVGWVDLAERAIDFVNASLHAAS